MGPAEPKTIYKDGEMGSKFVTPTPGQAPEELVKLCLKRLVLTFSIQPFRNSALGPAEPKTIYEEGDMGHKFVVPNPGKQSEETVE